MIVVATSHRPVDYRPDIDGLRAFAVIAVILFHLDETLLPGGFIGVDTFFVISGFVVTGSAIRSQTSRPAMDVLAFWRRRWLRIVPALLAFVAGSLLLVALFLPPFPLEAYRSTIRTGVLSTIGLSNLYLHRIGHDYFRADTTTNLFSHTWSLGVEEQFYLVFSILVVGLCPLLARGRSIASIRNLVVTTLTVLSLVWFLRSASTDPMWTYFQLPTRFWELGVGSLLALHVSRLKKLRPPAICVSIVQAFALAGLLVSASTSNALGGLPRLSIMLGVGSTAILIATGALGRPWVSRAFSTRALVWIGLLSYSLYLWHWPILTLFRYTVGLNGAATVVPALCLVAGLSYLTYRGVEIPLRWSRAPFRAEILPRFAFAMVLLIAGAWILDRGSGVLYVGEPQNWRRDWLPPSEHAYGEAGTITLTDCLIHEGGTVVREIPRTCFAGNGDENTRAAPPLVLAVGDSHAFANWGMVAELPRHSALSVATFVHDGCSANAARNVMSSSCREYWDWVPDVVRRTLVPGDVVFVSFQWYLFAGASYQPAWEQIARILSAAKSVGAQVIVEAPLPDFSRPGYTCMPEWYRPNLDGCSTLRRAVEDRRAPAVAHVRRLAMSDPHLSIWDPIDALCEQSCDAYRDGPIFRDNNHLSYLQARKLSPLFATFLTAPRPRTESQPR